MRLMRWAVDFVSPLLDRLRAPVGDGRIRPATNAVDRSILWGPGIAPTGHQVRVESEKPTGGMVQQMVPIGDMSGVAEAPERPKSCTQRGFMAGDGTCPDCILLLYRLDRDERGRRDGWDFSFGTEDVAGTPTPYLEMLLGRDDREPCGHREMGLYHYSILGKMRDCEVMPNPDREDGRWPLSADYDLIYRFKYKILERTPSACKGPAVKRRNLVKSIVMYDHLAPDGDIRKRRPNAISIWVDHAECKMKPKDRPPPRARWFDDDVLWWNACRAHGDWSNDTCMLTVWIGDSAMVRPLPDSDYIAVEINLSQLYRHYARAFPPPFGQTREDAVFRNIAVVSSVSQSVLRVRYCDVDLICRRYRE